MTSTIDYGPSIFLINGESYTFGSPALPAGRAAERTLVRLLNAGLESHVVVLAPPSREAQPATPAADGTTLLLVAEDGNRYADPRAQATVLLAAGKTHDAIWVPMAAGEFRVYDRALRLTALNQPLGGMLANLRVEAATADPGTSPVTAAADSATTLEDNPAVGSVLGNDTGAATAEIYSMPLAGVVTLQADGSFTYTPQANFSGVDAFWYRAVATNGTDRSAPTLVAITVTPVPDVPTALPLTIGLTAGGSKPITMNGLDADGDPLTIRVTGLPANGTLSITDPATGLSRTLTAADLFVSAAAPGAAIPGGTAVYTPDAAAPYSGPDTFAFLVTDGFGGGVGQVSAPASVGITVDPAPAAAVVGTPITLTVEGIDPRTPGAASQPITAYRWTLEEDRTYNVVPGVLDPNTLSVSFHRSYMPVRPVRR